MKTEYIILASLLFIGASLQAQEFCNYDTATGYDLSGTYDEPFAVTTQDDGWILAVGGSGTNFAFPSHASLIRFDVNRNLDSDFGVNGRVQHSWSDWNVAQCVTLQDDGKILIAGISSPAFGQSGSRAFVARLYNDGSIDETFAMSGFFRFDVPTNSSGTLGIQARPDGTIRAVVQSAAPVGFYMLQLDTSGEFDTTFNSVGYVFNGVSESRYWTGTGDAIFTPDGGATVVSFGGSFAEAFTHNPLIFKIDSSGVPDNQFNEAGVLEINEIVDPTSDIYGLTDPAGDLYVAYTPNVSDGGYHVYKMNALSGQTVDAFGIGGKAVSTETSPSHVVYGIIQEPSSGNIMVYGQGGGGVQTESSIWMCDSETGLEVNNCGGTDMWDLPLESTSGFRAACVTANETVQFVGMGSATTDSTSIHTSQASNFLLPHSSIPSNINEYEGLKFSIYPNPVQDYLTIKGLRSGLNYRYTVVNQLGASIQEGKCEETIDLSSIPNGVYSLRIQSVTGIWGVQRIIR